MSIDKNEYIFGIRSAIEALDSGRTINKILIQKGLSNELFRELTDKINDLRHLVQYVPLQKLNSITRKNHQGVIAFISPVDYYTVEQLLPQIYESGESPLFLMLDRITDVRNFGAIARTAECLGVHGIIVPYKGGALINADAIKTSAGALHKIPVCREQFLDKTAGFLKESGLQIVSVSEKTDALIHELDYTIPTCLIMGSEEDGINSGLLKISDHHVKIQMSGTISSLNVGVAAGIGLYEISKQRFA